MSLKGIARAPGSSSTLALSRTPVEARRVASVARQYTVVAAALDSEATVATRLPSPVTPLEALRVKIPVLREQTSSELLKTDPFAHQLTHENNRTRHRSKQRDRFGNLSAARAEGLSRVTRFATKRVGERPQRRLRGTAPRSKR
jgi:hypothetical protein